MEEDRAAMIEKCYKGWDHNGRQVIDERCDCGHLRSEHGDRFARGHGDCLMPDCGCPQFTWVGYVTGSRAKSRLARGSFHE